MSPPEITDDHVAQVMALMRGAFGPWLHTYPDKDGPNLHTLLLECERRGLVRRYRDEPGHVCWEPAEGKRP